MESAALLLLLVGLAVFGHFNYRHILRSARNLQQICEKENLSGK